MSRSLVFSLLTVLFIAIQPHAGLTRHHSRIHELNVDQTLIDFLLNTRNFQQSDPKRSNECFGYYLPKLTDCYEEYEEEYSQCLESSEDRRKKIDKSTYKQRDEIEDSSEHACKLLENCVPNKDSIDYFECFELASNTNERTMYNVNVNASDMLGKVRQAYSESDYQENVCLVDSKRKYDGNNKIIYNSLQSCLNGKFDVPTTTTADPSHTTKSTTYTSPDPTTTEKY
uniref:Protein TsetseEP domain-containing protein n=1 Tax=Bactrocera latifrons TaxID=174628 RepID=A0A0K8VJH4_BACLA